MKTITVKVPAALALRLGRAAVRRRSTRSAIVREAIETGLATERQLETSCFDLAADLAGVINGRRDLSSNRRRLRGYGR